MLSTFNFFNKTILSQKLTSAPMPTRPPLKIKLALPPETLPGTLLPAQELESQLMLCLHHTQDMPNTSNLDLRTIPFQRLTSALMPTKPLLKIKLAPPLETLLGTPSPLPEPESQLLPPPLHIQDMPSTFNWRLPQRPTSAPTPTRLPPTMRLAPPPATLPGTPPPHPELETQLMPSLIHTQDTNFTESKSPSDWMK